MLTLRVAGRGLIRVGTFSITDARGRRLDLGTGQPPRASIRLHDRWIGWRLGVDPQLALGEGLMDGRITVEDGSVYDLLDLILRNSGWSIAGGTFAHALHQARLAWRRVAQFNPARRSRKNVAHHYDLSDALYDLFLDEDRQYSCAYFLRDDDSLEQAQAQKKRHIAAKLLLEPGQSVIDVGSGWGGLGLYLAEAGGVDVTGLTLSEEQVRISNARAAAAGFGNRVRFKLQDYRTEQGTYDRLVSVGMFEHVGVNHYGRFFRQVAALLKPDGVGLIHTIGRADGPGVTNPFIAKYIFPGGYSPALSEVLPAIEKAGLHIADIEVWRLHYAETLRHWRERFLANRDKVRELYDERFCRMWEFYLAGSEAMFRHGGHVVFQIQLAKQIGAVPLTRDYIGDFEAAHPLPPAIAPPRRIAAE